MRSSPPCSRISSAARCPSSEGKSRASSQFRVQADVFVNGEVLVFADADLETRPQRAGREGRSSDSVHQQDGRGDVEAVMTPTHRTAGRRMRRFAPVRLDGPSLGDANVAYGFSMRSSSSSCRLRLVL